MRGDVYIGMPEFFLVRVDDLLSSTKFSLELVTDACLDLGMVEVTPPALPVMLRELELEELDMSPLPAWSILLCEDSKD